MHSTSVTVIMMMSCCVKNQTHKNTKIHKSTHLPQRSTNNERKDRRNNALLGMMDALYSSNLPMPSRLLAANKNKHQK
jgi:hypothetical protein